MQERTSSLIAWQWRGYAEAHRDRRNLLVHALTNPVFVGGGVALAAGVVTLTWWLALAGVIAMPIAMALQGIGHRLEPTPPAPFRGPLDVLLRIVTEQWITFPRFIVSGAFARAWREASR